MELREKHYVSVDHAELFIRLVYQNTVADALTVKVEYKKLF